MTDAPVPAAKARILVADDQKNMRSTTALLLRSAGYETAEAASGEEALQQLMERPVDVLLTDLKMQPMDGLSLLKKALEFAPQMQVLVMTAYGSIETAVEAMRSGAYDYLTKPFKEEELLIRVQKSLEQAQLVTTVKALAGEFSQRHGLSALVGTSAKMQELTARIVKVAATDATVLIEGESGTGKELVARALHALSRRNNRPFVPVNCAAITESLLESELFGHARGAFTGAVRARRGLFEEADGGTLFIDEVTETTTAFQTKLLRVLQDGEVRRVGESTALKVDARTVAATNRSIELEVAQKRFRQDLYYRLNVVQLWVPPLRARLEDVPLLAEHFLARANQRNLRVRHLSEEALSHLMGYDFPGNVRELENLVEQAAALAETDELTAADFPLRRPTHPDGRVAPAEGKSLADLVSEAERAAIVAAMEKNPHDLGAVAHALNVSSTTLWRKMKRLGIKNQ